MGTGEERILRNGRDNVATYNTERCAGCTENSNKKEITMSNYKLISVESRKGGVGKTTAALNVGYLLKDKCHVLLLDIDITGTSISAIRESRFWVTDTKLLEKNNKSINLLQFFTKNYLKGDDLFDFSLNHEQEMVQVYADTINVIASELYGEDTNLLYDPSILLESLHVYWLTKLIKGICEKFENCFDDGKQCVVILDNSPGFVGIGKAVHDIMTDLGPERAKFLTVSSLDIQDLESSLKSVYALHQEYVDKLNGSRYPETQKGDESFYAQVQLSGTTEYLYYKKRQNEATLSSYQGLIVNKVAKNFIEGRTRYNYQKYLTDKLKDVFDKLYNGRVKDYLVPFDNELLTQFYGVFDEKQNEVKPSQTTLKRRLNTISYQVKMLDELGPEKLPFDLLRRAEGFDKTLDTLKGALIACGYETIASKFNSDWSPVEPLRKMIDVLKRIGFASDGFELYVPRQNRMLREMEYFHGMVRKAIAYAEERKQEHVWLAAAVASVACELSFSYSNKILWNNQRVWSNDEIWGDSKGKWADMVNDALYDWMIGVGDSYNMYVGEQRSLAAYVISNEASGCDNSLKELFDNDEFVMTLKQAVSRLVDLASDMKTLVNLIRIITIYNEGSYSKDVDYVEFLNHKIVDKRYDYNEAKDRMYSELRDSDYMAAYRLVLKRVIRNWGM